jgi:Uma2 family endonuclease
MSQHTFDAIPQPHEGAVHTTTVDVPPLKAGDYLTRDEFERRYHARPDLKKAELIEGRVCMPSPARFQSHSEPHGWIIGCLTMYCAGTPGVRLGDNATVRLDLDNEPQPDAILRIEPSAGGHSLISEDDYLEGAPELVVEIAASSASYDLHEKLRVYHRNGVQEYIVWRVYDKQLDWFALSHDEYVQLTPNASHIIESQVFPGLRLDVAALLAGNLAQVLSELQKGLGTPTHSAFVERLRNK